MNLVVVIRYFPWYNTCSLRQLSVRKWGIPELDLLKENFRDYNITNKALPVKT